jgi:hypothetical protein
MNKWLAKARGLHPLLEDRKIVDVRTIKMTARDRLGPASRTSKFDRSQRHLQKLRNEGREVAEQWLSEWRTRGKDFDAIPTMRGTLKDSDGPGDRRVTRRGKTGQDFRSNASPASSSGRRFRRPDPRERVRNHD